MNITLHQSKVVPIRKGDKNFTIIDGMVTYPRAMVHILPQCPHETRDQINFALAKGWLQPVAHMTEREMLFIGLASENTNTDNTMEMPGTLGGAKVVFK